MSFQRQPWVRRLRKRKANNSATFPSPQHLGDVNVVLEASAAVNSLEVYHPQDSFQFPQSQENELPLHLIFHVYQCSDFGGIGALLAAYYSLIYYLLFTYLLSSYSVPSMLLRTRYATTNKRLKYPCPRRTYVPGGSKKRDNKQNK